MFSISYCINVRNDSYITGRFDMRTRILMESNITSDFWGRECYAGRKANAMPCWAPMGNQQPHPIGRFEPTGFAVY